jgi:hypothetical protein
MNSGADTEVTQDIGEVATKKPRGRRCRVVLQFIEHYPDENPIRTVEDITQVLSYVGLFDGMKK